MYWIVKVTRTPQSFTAKAPAGGGSLLRPLEFHDVFSLQTLGALGDREFHALALGERLEPGCLNGGVVDENVPAGSALDKSIALRVVKPLHRALFFFHVLLKTSC